MVSFVKRFFKNETSGNKSPKQWLIDWIRGGDNSSAGIHVNARTAMTFSSVYQAINLISGDIAKLPVHLYEDTGRGKKRLDSHPAFRLVRYKASPELAAFYFKRIMLQNALLQGNAYAYIFRDSNTYRPIELRVLDPWNTHPIRENGELLYVTRVSKNGDANTGEYRKLSPANVFHIRG